jgi:diacylglycerol O-acyltransferase / wax synthase
LANADRLTALDSAFLHLERDGVHMHVASCLIFEGATPSYDDVLHHIEQRLHLVPRYRQKLAFVPYDQGRPVWVDDPYFNARFHLRHAALPKPGTEEQLKQLCGRVFSQQLDRNKPLWEIWLVDKLEGDRFALLAKTHHALVDGVSGVDITTILFDTQPSPPPPEPPWVPRPLPSGAQLLGEALVERATIPAELGRGVRALLRGPRRVASRLVEDVSAIGAFASGGLSAPDSPLNTKIGPHRRFDWVQADLADFKAIKNELGGTINDVVLTAVTLALGRWLRDRGHPCRELTLKAMVPVSVRADVEQGALGNRVAAMWAPLPVWSQDAIEVFGMVHGAMGQLKESGQAVGAAVLTQMSDFAPTTVLAQATRLQARQRFFNLVVTNVPGPQFPLYLLGNKLLATHPLVPLAGNQGLGIAIMSYDGKLNFGLNGDYEALADITYLADDLRASIDHLKHVAGAVEAVAEEPLEQVELEAVAEEEPDEATDFAEAVAEADPDVRGTPPPAFSMPRTRPGIRSPRRPSSPGE